MNGSQLQDRRVAFGWPGAKPTWAAGDKDGVGTAYSAASRLWFTIWRGIVTEIHFPTVDRPQLRDLQFLISDGSTFVEDELGMTTRIAAIDGSLGYRVEGESKNVKLRYQKEIIADPHLSCVLQNIKIEADPDLLKRIKFYVLCAPHLDGAGGGNHAKVAPFLGRNVLTANRNDSWLAMACRQPFSKVSVGYVGSSDGWTDLHQHFSLDWEWTEAADGNVALTGEIDLSDTNEFTLGVAFGGTEHRALATLIQSLAFPFDEHRQTFVGQWSRVGEAIERLEDRSFDGGELYRTSVQLLLAHEDKYFPGAMIASLATPWGEAKGDDEGKGGYHLIWTRDMVQSAMALGAAGKTETALRALIFLAASQNEDGSFAQNFWVEGTPFWTGQQLDEMAFPILLAHKLWTLNQEEEQVGIPEIVGLPEMGFRAVMFLLKSGPVTKQERWEEAGGISPSTIAVVIAALICAADFARHSKDETSAAFLERHADWLEQNVERWTVTNNGSLLPEVKRHYVRLTPAQPGKPPPEDGVADRVLQLKNQPPGSPTDFPAKDIVDAGFLELVRYGIRGADDPTVVDSLKVVDAFLKVETESGTIWRRYNNDGYGQGVNGEPYNGFGKGRAWPLLTGERGHYELAAGHDASDYIRSMEKLATATHLLPEQSWDQPDSPDNKFRFGRPTGSAVPLLWAHAEYVKLLRSARDGAVFDFIPQVAERYIKDRFSQPPITVWSFAYPSERATPGGTLRVQANANFELRFSFDQWTSAEQLKASPIRSLLFYVDIEIPRSGSDQQCLFTFYWPDVDRWEGRDFAVEVREGRSGK